MKAIDNTSALHYCHGSANILTASIAFLVGGTKYTSAPTVGFSGGGGSGAAGTALMVDGRITGVTITNAGTGYTTAPTIAFTGGGGAGAAATAVLSGATVGSVTITNGGGKNITITDNTVYPAGDSRVAVNITLADRFGKHVEKQIDDSPNNLLITLGDEGLNDVDGIDILATVVSALGKHKNGSIHDTVTIKQSGNLVMDK